MPLWSLTDERGISPCDRYAIVREGTMVAQAHMTIKIGRVLIGLTVLWSFLGLSGIESWAFDDETARATLRGVAGVQVVVERLKLEVERHGLTSQQLQTDVELRLRKAGIPVLTDQERRKIPGQPWLYVTVNVFLDSDELAGLVVFDIDVTLYQWASLDADASSAIVATWATAYFGRVGVRHLHTLREEVRDQVDRF